MALTKIPVEMITGAISSDDLAASSGAGLVGAKRTLAQAVETTLALWHDAQWINAKSDYSITANGVVDNTVLMQAAATDANGLIVYLGSGTYRLTSTITSKPVLYVGDGIGKTVIVFDNFSGKNGFTFTAGDTVGATGGFVGCEFVAKGQNGLTAIECPKNATQYSDYFTKWIFRDLYMHGNVRDGAKYGFAWDYSFAKWIRASDCNGLTIENVNIQGAFDIKTNPSGQLSDIGIELDAASAILSARINNIAIGPIHTGIAVGDRSFFSISNFDIIGAYRGIYQTGTTIYNEPKIGPGNINAQETGIYFSNSDSRDISSVTIRRHSAGWKGATHDWYGIKFDTCTGVTLSRNVVQPDESGGAYAGTMYGISAIASSLSSYSDNYIGPGNDIGINLDNCTGFNVNGSITAQNAASDVLFNLINNTRVTSIGGYEIVSSFAGTVIAKDASIVGAIQMMNQNFDLQGTGTINRDTTRVNAAVDTKKWRETTATASQQRQVLTDAGVATNFELVTRTGATVDQIEWRATQFKLNNGPILRTGSNTPEGVITAPIGSLFLRVNGGAVTTLYVKESGAGNTGWVAK